MCEVFWLKEKEKVWFPWDRPTGHEDCDYCATLESFNNGSCLWSGWFQNFLSPTMSDNSFNYSPPKARYLVKYGKDHLDCICAAFNNLSV